MVGVIMNSKEWMEKFIVPKLQWASKKTEERLKVNNPKCFPDAERFPSCWYQYIDQATLGQDMTVFALLKLQETLEEKESKRAVWEVKTVPLNEE